MIEIKTKKYGEKHIHNYTIIEIFFFTLNPMFRLQSDEKEECILFTFFSEQFLGSFSLFPFCRFCISFNKWSKSNSRSFIINNLFCS